jgi:hypothetical protein
MFFFVLFVLFVVLFDLNNRLNRIRQQRIKLYAGGWVVYAIRAPNSPDACLPNVRFGITAKQRMRHDGINIFSTCGLQ